ncbi:MAG TPA: glycerol-3-phosphate 1-O-acyltransferase PlsY [Burkholderiales bacterium]|nr:glycerol-3-phosphate 1-O-acyltransferase PlsY [Burkholderiales bacterium]
MTTIAAALGAYLIGSISFAVIVSRAMGLPDPRTFGSGNPGATNVLRSGRKTAAVLTLLGDGGKGWLAVCLAQHLVPVPNAVTPIGAAAVAAVVGHMYPLFFRFRGGKGVATALGVLIGLDRWLGLVALAVWLVTAGTFRISSLASIVAVLAATAWCAYWYRPDHPYFWSVLTIALLVIWRHRGNIQKLLAGTESRIGGKRT